MFEDAVRVVLRWEAGYVVDEGGATKYGISQNGYPKIDIINLTLEQATGIYRTDYWNKCRCDDLPDGLALLVFDSAVNQGPGSAAILLQESLGVLVDGKIGPMTIAAARTKDPKKAVHDYAVLRILRYVQTKDWSINGKGWMNRLVDMIQNAE
jgi:lysozyme family protein